MKKKTFDAYYYSFDATGEPAIDAILMLLGMAGKSYHSTECWSDEIPTGMDKPYTEQIQDAANEAAKYIAVLRGADSNKPEGE